MKNKKYQRKINDLIENDVFALENNVYQFVSRNNISKSFCEVHVINENDEKEKIRLRNEDVVNVTVNISEAEYQGKKVNLNKPFRQSGGKKKFGVYVRNQKGNIIKVSFGDPNMEIKRDDPERRKNFRARHNCDEKNDKTKAGYWSCRQWRAGSKVEDSYDPQGEMLSERSLTQAEKETRDKLAKDYIEKGDLNPTRGSVENMAYALATIRAKGENPRPRGKNKEKGKKRKKRESKNEQFYDYLNNGRLKNLNEITRYRREDR
jgi:hypothetical protein